MLHLRDFLSRHLTYGRPRYDDSLSQMLPALIYPILLGLDRLETSAFLRHNSMFQYLRGLPGYPDPQSLRRFLLQAPPDFREQLHRLNDRLLRRFVHQPEHRSRLVLDLDSTVITVFGHQEDAAVGYNTCYNPRYRGKRSYDPLVCQEANYAFLWDAELRTGKAGTWKGSRELLASCLLSLPAGIRESRVRADAGFGFDPVLAMLEHRTDLASAYDSSQLPQDQHRPVHADALRSALAAPGRDRAPARPHLAHPALRNRGADVGAGVQTRVFRRIFQQLAQCLLDKTAGA